MITRLVPAKPRRPSDDRAKFEALAYEAFGPFHFVGNYVGGVFSEVIMAQLATFACLNVQGWLGPKVVPIPA
jgi:hypothetical protein